MEGKSEEVARSTENAACSLLQECEDYKFKFFNATVKNIHLECQNGLLRTDVLKILKDVENLKNEVIYWKSCFVKVKEGRGTVDMECVCKNVQVELLNKKIAELEEEKRNHIISSDETLKNTRLAALERFKIANAEILNKEHLVKELNAKLQNLLMEKDKFRALNVESNRRVAKMQRERTVEYNKYMEGKLKTQNCKIDDLNKLVMDLQAEKQNNLATIARLEKQISQSKDKNCLTNIVAESKNKAADPESEILQLKNKLMKVNEKFKQLSDLQIIEIQNLNKEIAALKLDKEKNQGKMFQMLNNNMDEIAQLKRALIEVEGKFAEYSASANAKDTEINQLQNKINIMQSEATKEIEKAAKKRPLEMPEEMRDTLTVTCTTKKMKSLHSSGSAVTSNNNNEALEYVGTHDRFSSNLEPEEDSSDSILSCDVFSLINSDRNRWMALCRDPVTPFDDCISTQTDNCIVANSSVQTDNISNSNITNTSVQVSEISVMESEHTTVPTGSFGLQTSKIASDNVSPIKDGPMKTPFCIGDKATENKAMKPGKVISPDEKFNIERLAHNCTLSVISSRVKKDDVETTQTIVRDKKLDVETITQDKNPTVICLESKEDIVTAENSKIVSETTGKKVTQLVVPQNYTLPNTKPKRVAHVPNPSSSFLSDGLHIARIPIDSSFMSNKGKKIKKSSKLQSIKKRISKTCAISFKNSSKKTLKVMNNQVTQKTAALTQHLNMLETATLNKSRHHKMLQKRALCNITDVRDYNNSQQLPTQQQSCLPETTMQTHVPGLFEDFPNQFGVDKAEPFEPCESKMATHSFKQKADEFSFHYNSQPNKQIKKYEKKILKCESNIVSLQKNEKQTCEALNSCLNRSKLSVGTVSDVDDQNCLNYRILPTVNITEKSSLESTLTVDRLVSDIHNDPKNLSKKNIFQIFSANESINTVPASYIRSQSTFKKSQTFDSKSVLLNNSQPCIFSESNHESEKNVFQISKTKESLLTKVPVSYYKLETACRKSVTSDNTSAILTNLQSGNFSGLDCMLSDVKPCKEFQKQNSPVLKNPILSDSENIPKDVDKQVPAKFSFYTSSANTGEYDVDMNSSLEVSERKSSGKCKKEVPSPYVHTVFNDANDPHKKNKECSFKAETHHVTSVSSAKIISSFCKSQEVSQVSLSSCEEILQQNCGIFLKCLSKCKNRMNPYNFSKRLIGNRETLLDIITVIKTFNKMCQPNANNQDILSSLKLIHPEVLFPLTVKLLEGPDYKATWYDLCTFFVKWRKEDISPLLDYIHQRLMKLRNPPLSLSVVRKLSSFYVKLSLKDKQYSRLEALVLDALYCMQHATGIVIGQFLEACPDYLPPPSVTNDDPWLLVLVHSVFNVKMKYRGGNPLIDVEDVKKRLETVHGYKRGQHSFLEIVKILFKKLKAGELYKLESSFLVLSKRVEWNHSYTYIVQREIFPIIDDWIKGNHILSDEAMAMLIRLVGFMARGINIKKGKEQIQAITRKLLCLCELSSMPEIVAKALFSALVSHARQDFEGVLDYVLNWKWGLDNLDISISSFLAYKPVQYWYKKIQEPELKVPIKSKGKV